MGNPGFDPGSSALQADAFTRLAYFPKWEKQDSNLQCFPVTDLQSAAITNYAHSPLLAAPFTYVTQLYSQNHFQAGKLPTVLSSAYLPAYHILDYQKRGGKNEKPNGKCDNGASGT